MGAVSAAGLTYFWGDGELPPELRLLEETPTAVVLGWDPVPGAAGYRLSSEKMTVYVHTWNVNLQRFTRLPPCNTSFSKCAWYKVEVLMVKDTLDYPGG